MRETAVQTDNSGENARLTPELSTWQQWLLRPEQMWLRRIFFQIHLWVGMAAALYVVVLSLSGSAIVFRNELENSNNSDSIVFRIVEWLVDLHEDLLFGMTGRGVNGIGAFCFTVLCLTGAFLWWPGIAHWRRSMRVNWRASFARLNWDLHNALGFWCFFLVSLWGISGIYFAFPDMFNWLTDHLDPPGTSNKLRVSDLALLWLSNLHFGRFGWLAETLWTVLGLVPAILAFTGVFMCCHRLFVRKGAPLFR
jgi:uncharacterized iron-regulated membrane protein